MYPFNPVCSALWSHMISFPGKLGQICHLVLLPALAPHDCLRYNLIINHWLITQSIHNCPTLSPIPSFHSHRNPLPIPATTPCGKRDSLPRFPPFPHRHSGQLPATAVQLPIRSSSRGSSTFPHCISLSCHPVETFYSQGSIYNYHSPCLYSHIC